MRRLVLSFILVIATLFLFMPTQQANALRREQFYTVRVSPYTGVSPDLSNMVVGEWFVDCSNYWDGWGSMPGSPDTYYELTHGELCVQWP